MSGLLKKGLIGGRVIKTCLAAFVTAFICEALHWPPLFAVMTSIVSIENTSVDSFKKGLVRFPASAIGAAFAMFFEAILGRGALTYGLSSSLTLIACLKLKLYDGVIVAVLTAVAMIPETYGHYLDSFIIRLGTTLTGIAVATAINYFVLPPNYMALVEERTRGLTEKTAQLLKTLFDKTSTLNKQRIRMQYQEITKSLEHAFRLIRFQRLEWHYHRRHTHEIKKIIEYQKRLEQLQNAMYHIGNLIYSPVRLSVFADSDQTAIRDFIQSLAEHLRQSPNQQADQSHFSHRLKHLYDLYYTYEEKHKKSPNNPYSLSPQGIILYELLSIYEIITLNNLYQTNDRD